MCEISAQNFISQQFLYSQISEVHIFNIVTLRGTYFQYCYPPDGYMEKYETVPLLVKTLCT